MKKLLCILIMALWSMQVEALNIIRDAEVESVLTKYAKQIFSAAGLNPENAQVVLVNDDSINAFVAGGQTIFVHTGLITHATSMDDVIFVMSHETGHIVGGHVIRGMEAMKKAQITALMTTVLGGLVAVAGSRPDAGIAIMAGSQGSVMGSFLANRPTEESAADRTAMDILSKTGHSSAGFLNVMKEIQNQERLNTPTDNGYFGTHPLTRDRILALERFTQTHKEPEQNVEFNLMKAKLVGFLNTPAQTRHLYNKNNLWDKYANVIADYKDHKLAVAMKSLDTLIAENPKNPFFHELKGQFLFETGKINESVVAYKQAVALAPESVLIRVALGQALLESSKQTDVKQAVKELEQVVKTDQTMPGAWRLLATAYGKNNQTAMADYAMAEYYLATDNIKEAKRLAERAIKNISVRTPTYYKLNDILSLDNKYLEY